MIAEERVRRAVRPSLSEAVPPEVAERVLTRALRRGGEFAEIYAEVRVSYATSSDRGRVERVTSGVQVGVGIRVAADGVSALAFTERLEEDALLVAADSVARVCQASASPGSIASLPPTAAASNPEWEIDRDERVALVARGDTAAYAADSRIEQVSVFLGTIEQEILVATSDGRYLVDERPRLRYRVQAIARSPSGKRIGVGSYAPGVTERLDFLDRLTPEDIARRAAHQALVQLDAVPAPAAAMPVVLGNGAGGVLIHEACGHGLEADSIERRSSVFAERLGTRVGSPAITVVDDGSLPGAWGSSTIDDEGERTGPTTLIEAGILRSYLTDRRTARTRGERSTGNGRRASFRHLPFPRMTNTFIAPGEAAPEDVIADTRFGLYARSLAGGQANPSNGSFIFTVREGYLIRRGRIDRPVVGATLAGQSLDVLAGIDLVANDLDIVAANCAREGQRIFVGVGQPTIRVSGMLVGGTGSSGEP